MLEKFKLELLGILSKQQIVENELLRYAYSTDASLYRMVPKLVLVVKLEQEVQKILKLANEYDIKLTFRTAGTSLSGQAVTDQILVILASDSWLDYKIYENGKRIKLQPGIIGGEVNKYLKIHERKIGPDPGSINTAKIGGIIANNSSGMCCGTAKNSYATLDSMRVIFNDGSILDTSDYQSIEDFKQTKKSFLNTISRIQTQILQDDELTNFIKKKFSIKNTSGYSLNAFLDFKDPIKVVERLIVGSEGTLGFVSNVTLNTVPDYKYKALNLVYGKLDDLVKLTTQIEAFNLSSVELLDYASLKSVVNNAELKPFLISLEDFQIAAIMIELAESNSKDLDDKLKLINSYIEKTNIIHQVGFIKDEAKAQILWKIRNGIVPTIAGLRPSGSSIIIEDIAVNILDLPSLIAQIRKLFDKYRYVNAAIFGHVLAGNIHFVITPDFHNNEEVLVYDKFMHELADIVTKGFNGSLKAEHGSGRNISPFAIVEWGEKCWNIMWQIKKLFDPKNILNPDVKLTHNKNLHIQNLKKLNVIGSEIDKCMECGFCEPVCPSRNLSLTPRQRNAVIRKIPTLPDGDKQKWQKDFEYYGVKTCATTSLCKTRCPVDIDTGAFILKQKKLVNKLVNHSQEINKAKRKVKLANLAGNIIGKTNLQKVTKILHNHFKSIPVYLETMPKVQDVHFKNSVTNNDNRVLLIPSCPNKIFASNKKYSKYPNQLVLEKLGFDVHYPEDLQDICCGQMYNSKANYAQQHKSQELLSSQNLNQYDYVVIDNSSCASFAKQQNIALTDINSFIIENINTTKLTKKFNKIALHIDCSTRKQNLDEKYTNLLKLCCNEVILPERIYCCGFAGDKGFTTPELNANSLSSLADQIKGCDIGVSFNRSCQIGLSYHSNMEYISFVELILECISLDI
ncbi:putative D-lactate dehydrogenase, Fe-S protein, FAD/FMN-containing [Francisella sp. W12-1067]|nr:putative D-lactate dehydrogenase, Fe-S protein, FAD/FMN-containing [Francisella sp. W12-1067]